ncbi:MAG: sugar ABC transporter permease [Hyphomicrobiales bacterium]|nr:sugar ABC transporter permease [Hyphomicrobiales bacterium]
MRVWQRPKRRGALVSTCRFCGPWLLLAPFLLGSVLLIAVPIALTVPLSLYEYDGLAPPVWRGASWNFRLIFDDPVFVAALRNSAFFVVLAVPMRMAVAFGLAMLLQRRRYGTAFYRASVFLPTIIPDVAYAVIWLWIFNPLYGPLNFVLAAFGLPRLQWLVDPATALPAIVLMSLFQIGEAFVLMIAALRTVPHQYYEAAALDGAGRGQSFLYITLPLVGPWLLLLTLRDIVMTAQNVFVAAYIMTQGGPYYATTFVPLLVHEEAFDRLRFGDAAAMMVIVYAAVALLLLLAVLAIRLGHYETEKD